MNSNYASETTTTTTTTTTATATTNINETKQDVTIIVNLALICFSSVM